LPGFLDRAARNSAIRSRRETVAQVRTREGVMKWIVTVVGLVLVALGVVWSLQGAGALAGSVMTGQRQWLYIGVVVGIVGLVLLLTGVRRRTARRRRPTR
jgi:Na+/melibiose symporter-like transporter